MGVAHWPAMMSVAPLTIGSPVIESHGFASVAKRAPVAAGRSGATAKPVDVVEKG